MSKTREYTKEITEKLEEYSKLLIKWNKSINLISKVTEQDIWNRHIEDSAQMIEYLDVNRPIIDLGSGAGLPGIILSICGMVDVTLVESDSRKCAFLNSASKISQNNLTIINSRIEDIDPVTIDPNSKIVSRALAKISMLLGFYSSLQISGGLLLLKGENFTQELEEAFLNWDFDYRIYESKTNSKSALIDITNVKHKR